MATTTPRRPRLLDLRSVIAGGGEPFPPIIAAFAALPTGETLLLITPFLPSPLIEKMQGEGFEARPERRHDGAWETRFRQAGT